MRVCRLTKITVPRENDLVGDGQKTSLAGTGWGVGTATSDECFAAVQPQPKAKPRHRAANRSLGNAAVGSGKTVVHYVHECRLACLGRTSNDVDVARPEGQYTLSAVMAVHDDVKNLHSHGRNPINARTVDPLPVCANHLPSNSALLTQ